MLSRYGRLVFLKIIRVKLFIRIRFTIEAFPSDIYGDDQNNTGVFKYKSSKRFYQKSRRFGTHGIAMADMEVRTDGFFKLFMDVDFLCIKPLRCHDRG